MTMLNTQEKTKDFHDWYHNRVKAVHSITIEELENIQDKFNTSSHTPLVPRKIL